MRLNDLPAEVLAQILVGPLSSFAVELWLCGDRLLNAKLSYSGVQELIAQEGVFFARGRVPKVLEHFRLRFVELSLRATPFDYYETRRSLQAWNPTLISITLSFRGVMEMFFGTAAEIAALQTDADNSDLKRRYRPCGLNTTEMQRHVEPWDLHSAFPVLQTLVLEDDLSGDSDEVSWISDAHLWMVPRSLTHLSLQVHSDPDHWQDFSGLPVTLTDLSLPSETLTPRNMTALPRGQLRAISRNSLTSEGRHLLLSSYRTLLPNLERFPRLSRGRGLESLEVEAATTLGGGWPDILDRLKFRVRKLADIFQYPLPRQLTSLKIMVTRETISMNLERIQDHGLPTGLRKLRVQTIDWRGITSDLWPPALASMTYRFSGTLFDDWHMLPRSTTKLKIDPFLGSTVEGENEDVRDRVAHLGKTTLEEIDKNAWSEIRNEAEARKTGFSEKNLKAVEAGFHFGLPLNLQTICWRGFTSLQPASGYLTLPPRVTSAHLCLPSLHHLLDTLPASLTSLSLYCTTNCACEDDNAVIIESDDEEEEYQEWRAASSEQLLAAHMRFWCDVATPQLDVHQSPLFQAHNLVFLKVELEMHRLCLFAFLPRTLRVFEYCAPATAPKLLPVPQMRAEEVFRELPPKLEELRIDRLLLLPCEQWISHMPRRLTRAAFDSAYIHGADLTNLPSTLERLVVDSTFGLTVQHLHCSGAPRFRLMSSHVSPGDTAATQVPGSGEVLDRDGRMLLDLRDLTALSIHDYRPNSLRVKSIMHCPVSEIESFLRRLRQS